MSPICTRPSLLFISSSCDPALLELLSDGVADPPPSLHLVARDLAMPVLALRAIGIDPGHVEAEAVLVPRHAHALRPALRDLQVLVCRFLTQETKKRHPPLI